MILPYAGRQGQGIQITGKEAKQTNEDDANSKALRLAFELRYVHKLYANIHPIDATRMIGYTFVDTTFDKLEI